MVKGSITGIVLAGGKSRRMGTDKALMNLNGKPLIQYAIDALSPICSEVIISSNNNIYSFAGCEVWPDEIPLQAPMIGIFSCLKRSKSEINIVLSCDMPMVSTALLKYLLSQSDNYDITVPEHSNHKLEPLCGVYKKSIIPDLERFIHNQHFTMSKFIYSSLHCSVNIHNELTFANPKMFLNINTLDDFNDLL